MLPLRLLPLMPLSTCLLDLEGTELLDKSKRHGLRLHTVDTTQNRMAGAHRMSCASVGMFLASVRRAAEILVPSKG